MENLPVHWYRGLFLKPHHFQAQDRYWQEQLGTVINWVDGYGYGIFSLKHDSDALTAGVLRIVTLKARLPTGTLISQHQDGGLECDLKLESDLDSKVAFIVLPTVGRDKTNVRSETDSADESGEARYLRVYDDFFDENGESAARIDYRRLRLRLMFLNQQEAASMSARNELLSIGKFRLTSADSSSPSVDHRYAPAMMTMSAWPGMEREFLWDVYDRVRDQRDKVKRILSQIEFGDQAVTPRQLRRVWLLDSLNLAVTKLYMMRNARGLHPFHCYCQLADIVGKLSILSNDLVSEPERDFLPYDHDDPKPGFIRLRQRIYELMADESTLLRSDFKRLDDSAMFANLSEEWFETDRLWLLGVNRANLSSRDFRKLASFVHFEDWVFEAPENLGKYNQKQPDLLVLEEASSEVNYPDLPARSEWSFFKINRERSRAMESIRKENGLAMKPMIPKERRAKYFRKIDSYSINLMVEGTELPLRFALFAIKMT